MKILFQKHKGIWLMLVSSVCACVGQLLWKLSTIYGLFIMLAGFLFYAIGALVMIVAYRYGRLSVLQPMLSMNYIISIILGAVVLKEDISISKFVGVFIIISGVLLIVGGDEE